VVTGEQRRVLDLLRCGARIKDVAELERLNRVTIEGRLQLARRLNHCATTAQLLYEYGRSLPDERPGSRRALHPDAARARRSVR